MSNIPQIFSSIEEANKYLKAVGMKINEYDNKLWTETGMVKLHTDSGQPPYLKFLLTKIHETTTAKDILFYTMSKFIPMNIGNYVWFNCHEPHAMFCSNGGKFVFEIRSTMFSSYDLSTSI